MLWDLYQQMQIRQLNTRIEGLGNAPTGDALARDTVFRLEEKVDKLALITRAMHELLEESGAMSEQKLTAKILEIDLRDGTQDGRISPAPKQCPKCEAMMSPKFGRCLFCGYSE